MLNPNTNPLRNALPVRLVVRFSLSEKKNLLILKKVLDKHYILCYY